jgi:hypothetical protein
MPAGPRGGLPRLTGARKELWDAGLRAINADPVLSLIRPAVTLPGQTHFDMLWASLLLSGASNPGVRIASLLEELKDPELLELANKSYSYTYLVAVAAVFLTRQLGKKATITQVWAASQSRIGPAAILLIHAIEEWLKNGGEEKFQNVPNLVNNSSKNQRKLSRAINRGLLFLADEDISDAGVSHSDAVDALIKGLMQKRKARPERKSIARAIARERKKRALLGMPPSTALRARTSVSKQKRKSLLLTLLKHLHPAAIVDTVKAIAGLNLLPSQRRLLKYNVAPTSEAELERLLPSKDWDTLKAMLPPDKRRNCNTISNTQALKGIVVKVVCNVPWEYLPKKLCGSGMTCCRRLKVWTRLGIWAQMEPVIRAQIKATCRVC